MNRKGNCLVLGGHDIWYSEKRRVEDSNIVRNEVLCFLVNQGEMGGIGDRFIYSIYCKSDIE